MIARACVLAALLAPLAACAQQPLDIPSDPRARNTGRFPTFAATPAAAAKQLPQGQVNRTVRRLEGAEARALSQPEPMMVAERAAEIADAGQRADAEAPMMVEERIARLDAAGRRARNAAPPPTNETERLRRLGRNHVAETIRRIEER